MRHKCSKKHKLKPQKILIPIILTVLTVLLIQELNKFNELQKIIAAKNKAKDIYASATPSLPTPSLYPKITDSPDPTPKPLNEKILALRKEYDNDDIIGYLAIEDSTIDYPVMQSNDNSYYLNRDLNKEYSIAGSIFLDFENDISKDDDKNTIIYGHNMNANIMFHGLRFYVDRDYYDSHKYITFTTLYNEYTYEIFSFYRAKTDFYYIQVHFKEDQFETLLNEMIERSIYDMGVTATPDDHILTLSTCTNETDDTRFVINAKLVDIK